MHPASPELRYACLANPDVTFRYGYHNCIERDTVDVGGWQWNTCMYCHELVGRLVGHRFWRVVYVIEEEPW